MKYLVTILSLLLATNSFAQQYENAWEIPDLVQRGYKGKIKSVTQYSYTTKVENGTLVQDSLAGTEVYSFDENGFIIKLISDNSTKSYVYNNRKLIASIYSADKKVEFVDSIRWIKNGYISLKHNYDAGKGTVNKKVQSRDTTFFDSENLLASSKDVSWKYYNGMDSMVLFMYDLVLVTIATISRDEKGNPLKTISRSEVLPTPYLGIYKYEYYQ
ncbi:MAG: hypothetical protein EOP51_09760 [Sphingobacteriales bacterium]|nr:MAG: hypothetical protein EOP51_09760 [Sphingobacteriales bacterium]